MDHFQGVCQINRWGVRNINAPLAIADAKLNVAGSRGL